MNMKIDLPAWWQKFIRDSVASGRYGSESEVVHEALRLLEEQNSRIDTLKSEIQLGRKSGPARKFDADAVKRRGRAKLAVRKKA